MSFRSLFRVPGHRQFKYVPRFYDEDEEDLHNRIERIKLENEDSADAMKSRIASGLQRGRRDPTLRKKSILRSNFLILGIIAILLILVVLYINYELPRILELL